MCLSLSATCREFHLTSYWRPEKKNQQHDSRFCGFCTVYTSFELLMRVEFVRHGWSFFLLGKGWLAKRGGGRKQECSLCQTWMIFPLMKLWVYVIPHRRKSNLRCFCYPLLAHHFSFLHVCCIGCIFKTVLYWDGFTILVLMCVFSFKWHSSWKPNLEYSHANNWIGTSGAQKWVFGDVRERQEPFKTQLPLTEWHHSSMILWN